MTKRTIIEYMDGSTEVLVDETGPGHFGYRRGTTHSVYVDPNTGQAIKSKHSAYNESFVNPWGVTKTETKTERSYQPVKSVKVEESSNCIITTACTEVLGLPDNCDELKTLRNFRDNYLMNTLNGKIAVDLYYKIAGDILAIIDGEPDREKLLKTVFRKYIKRSVALIKKGKNEEAATLYVKAIAYLIERCAKKINN